MTNIVAALIFIFISVIMIGMDASVIRHTANNSSLHASVIVEAKELQEFTQAAYDYSESFNVPLSTTTLTVSNLISYGLLPSTFPETTPFGQTFVATYSTDTCNQDVMDLEIYTSGNYDSNLLSKNGLTGSLGEESLNSEVETELSKFNMSFVNAHNPCVNGGQSFYIGQTQSNSDTINLYGGGTVSTFNTAASTGVAVYVYAPNQWGYLVFSITDSIQPDWGVVQGPGATINGVNLVDYYPNLSSSGWGLSCPVGSDIFTATSFQNYGYTSSTNARIFYNNNYCIPAYKSQVNSLIIQNNHNFAQVFNLPIGQSFYNQFNVGGTDPSNAYMYGGYEPVQTSLNTYLGSITGINNNIYGVQNFFSTQPPFDPIPNGQYPGANFIPLEPLYNYFSSEGVDISINGIIYQIVQWKYSFITGTGITPAQAGMNQCSYSDYPIDNPSNKIICFPSGATIWQDAASGVDLGNSTENYGGGYYITKNPANPSSYSGTIDYVPYNGGPTYTAPFSIPTPLIN